MQIRSVVKAIVIHEDKILLNKCLHSSIGEHYGLPGGGQNIDETLMDAVRRECLEETGYTVEPERLLAVYELINTNKDFRRDYPEYVQRMVHLVLCRLADVPCARPSEIDIAQIGSEWIPLSELNAYTILPRISGAHLHEILSGELPFYLGVEYEDYPSVL